MGRTDEVAAFPGRFQPFHEGHYRVVREYRDEYSPFVVVVGSPNKSRTEENPLTATERESFSGTEIRRRIRGGEPWRELVPGCCEAQVANYVKVIRDT